jgi:cytochrome bd-type quinol oxidase subunit 2
MLSKIKRLIAATSAALLLAIGGTSAVVMAQTGNGNPDAQIQANTCQGSNLDFNGTPDSTACTTITGDSATQANSLVARIINIFSVVVGVVSVIMIIYGGFRYITSGGESGNITSAKNTILYAIIGLVIVALAQFIVKFVLAKATGSDSTT